MPTFSMRLTDEESAIIKSYAELKKLSVSELMRTVTMEKIEDEFDLKAYAEAMQRYQRNPKTYTLDEIEEGLGLR